MGVLLDPAGHAEIGRWRSRSWRLLWQLRSPWHRFRRKRANGRSRSPIVAMSRSVPCGSCSRARTVATTSIASSGSDGSSSGRPGGACSIRTTACRAVLKARSMRGEDGSHYGAACGVPTPIGSSSAMRRSSTIAPSSVKRARASVCSARCTGGRDLLEQGVAIVEALLRDDPHCVSSSKELAVRACEEPRWDPTASHVPTFDVHVPAALWEPGS